MTPTTDDLHVAAWRLFFSASNRVALLLDRELQQAHALSLAEFEVLDALRGGLPEGVRMTALAEQASISKSRLSHCVDRLVESGFVRRDRVDDDRRGLRAVLTEKGAHVCGEAADTHLRVRTRLLGDMFEGERGQTVLGELQKVVDRSGGRGINFA
jgi:DNA-binding MarR family transcriptional regulator